MTATPERRMHASVAMRETRRGSELLTAWNKNSRNT
jgi:hypothetical protein